MNTKLTEFIKRNRKRNAHLYISGLTEGYDYVVCPVSGERLSMIKDNYIVKVLEMDPERYPATQRICHRRKENIQAGLQEIDPVTGLTRYEIGQQKAREILKQVDSSGQSGYARKGQKTRATHMSRVDELGRNGYSRLATKAILKGNQTKADKGMISLNRDKFKRYKTIVLYLTQKHRKTLVNGFVTGLAGKSDAWHIDHMFSILKGYQQKVSPFVIGHLGNLQMLPWKDNISKHSKCSVTLDKLFEICDYSMKKSESEFDQIMQFIEYDITSSTPPNAAFLIERLYETNIR